MYALLYVVTLTMLPYVTTTPATVRMIALKLTSVASWMLVLLGKDIYVSSEVTVNANESYYVKLTEYYFNHKEYW